MYPITAELANLFANQRQVVRLTFDSVANNIVLTEENIKSGGLVIDRTCVSGDTIEFGSVIASELGVEINNASGQYNSVTFEGAECFVEVGTKDWSDEQTQVQYIPMGYFTVDGSPRKLDTISFKALDRMVKFDRPVDFTQLSFPMTVSALLSSICTLCGITLNTDYQSSWRNKTRSISTVPEGDNLTYRQLLSWICEIMGVCAYMSPAGTLNMHWYGQAQSSTPSIPASVRYSSDVEENTIALTGVRVINDDTVYLAGTDTYALTIEGNALLQNGFQTVANNLYDARGGLTYTPFTATVKSMPHIYPLDTVNFIKGETTIPTIITNTNFALNNSTALEGKGKTQIENNYAELNPMTTQQTVVLEKLHSKTVQEFKVADGELLSTIANSESKYDESTSPGTITLRGYGAPADAGYPAADHNGAYYLDEMTGFVYLSDGTSWSKVAELNLITTQLDTKIDQTAEGMLFSASQMIGGERTKNLIPFVYNATGSDAKVVNGVKLERNGEGFDLTRTSSSGSNGYFTIYTQDCSAVYDNDKLADVKTLPTGTYIISGTGFNNDIQYRIQYSTDGSTSSKIVYFGENNDTTEKTFSITDAMIYVRHYIWVRSGTDLGSGVTVKPMIRDASIVDDTYTPGIDSGAYMCSAINLTPEKLELDSGKLIINSGNFQLDENGVLTSTAGTFKTSNYTPASGNTKTVGGKLNLSATGNTLLLDTANFKIEGDGDVSATNTTLTGGVIKTSNYAAASGNTKTVGGQINLNATGSTPMIDTANFKVTGGGAVSAENATFSNCTIEDGAFDVVSTNPDDVSYINIINTKPMTGGGYKEEKTKLYPNSIYISEAEWNSEDTLIDQKYSRMNGGYVECNDATTNDKSYMTPTRLYTNYIELRGDLQLRTSLPIAGSLTPTTNSIVFLDGYSGDRGLLIISTDSNNNHEARVGNPRFPLKLVGSSILVNDKPIVTSAEIEARLEATVGHSCKNLLEITAETKTTNGVTFTSDIVNGTITAEGQTTNTREGSQYNFQGDGLRVINNIESGMLMSLEVESTPTITSGAYLAIGYYNSQQNYISEQRCIISVGELALSIPSNAAYYRLFVRKTRTAGGTTVVYKPMLRDGSIADDTFEPYVTPTDERIASLEAQVAALTALINGR